MLHSLPRPLFELFNLLKNEVPEISPTIGYGQED
jgi:hypothetical protein